MCCSEFYTRCVIGMRSLLSLHTSDMEEQDGDLLCLLPKDSLTQELESERVRACNILDVIMKVWGVVDAYLEMRRGYWRDPGPSVRLDNIDFSSIA